MRGLNAKNLVYIIKKKTLKNGNFISLFMFMYPPFFTPCILISQHCCL